MNLIWKTSGFALKCSSTFLTNIIVARKKTKTRTAKNAPKHPEHSITRIRLGQAGLVLSAMFGIFLFLALYSYNALNHADNLGGMLGGWCSHGLFSILGMAAYLVPLSLLYHAYIHWQELATHHENSRALKILRLIGWLLMLLSLSGLFNLLLDPKAWIYPNGPGGFLGNFAPHLLLPLLNLTGSIVILIAFFLAGLTLFSGKIWLKHFVGSLFVLGRFSKWLMSLFHFKKNTSEEEDETDNEIEKIADIEEELPFVPDPPMHVEPVINKKPVEPKAIEAPKPIVRKTVVPVSHTPTGEPPTIELLDPPLELSNRASKDELNQVAKLVEQKLADFGISATVMGVFQGPVVTRYEIQLAPGLKVSKLTTIDKDLARSLSVSSVRVVEVIPGKTYVGLELPNANRETVRLKEVLDSDAFRNAKSPIAMGLGKDISGLPEVVDMAKMPHLLVAGTTGSGKSVGLNAMLLSMLLKSSPKELRLIMIDPKMLELSIYEGVPHLLTPVVTDMKEAANALRWSVKEMDRRYRLMAALGVRNISGFNEVVNAAIAKGEPIKDPLWLQLNPGQLIDCPTLEPMPYIVVLVDEFADMMMVVGKKVEELITRLAQKARAAGIHLILATQRPSVDVITGLIKANVPSRIAFQVSSRIDSRTILDQQGAEQLLGYGDMLYMPVGAGVPIRVHGAYVSDAEVHRVVEAWKACGGPQYVDSILATSKLDDEEGAESEENGAEGETDPLYDEAVSIVLEAKRASISLVQRRLRIGYNRAARLLEDMEKAGLVSEIQPNGLREILVESN